MSDTDAQSEVKAEYEECKKTARAYLLAVGVLEPEEVSMSQFREREIRRIENVLLNDGTLEKILPEDPDAREACMLACKFQEGDHDPEILDTLLLNASKPACGMVVEVLKRSMLAKGADLPDQLRMWEPESNNVKKRRLRKNPTRNHLIGMVVEALVVGSNFLFRWEESEREQERLQRERDQLQVDLKAIHGYSVEPLEPLKENSKADGEFPQNLPEETLPSACEELSHELNRLPNEHVIEHLNQMRNRPWRHKNGGTGLTARDLVELTKQPVLQEAGIVGIMPQFQGRTRFPNLYATRNDATMEAGLTYSICDAVAEVLKEAGQPGDYRSVRRAWIAYRNLNQSPKEQ